MFVKEGAGRRGTGRQIAAKRARHASASAAADRAGNGNSRPDASAVRPALAVRGIAALASILEFSAPADAVLHRFFRAHAELGRRDRAFIAESTFACLRRLRWYSHLAGGSDPRRLFLLAADRLHPRERRDLSPVLSENERAWLEHNRNAQDAALPLGVRAELPDWVLDALGGCYDERELLAIGRGMQTSAPLDLRVNTLKSSRADALATLQASGLAAEPMPYSPLGVRIQGRPALEQHPLYREGGIEVQDEGSQLLGFLLAPKRREMVADFCAGAGGKTLLLGALMRSEGRLYAFVVSAARIRRLHVRLARSGLSNVQPEALAHENDVRLKRLAGKLDRVLVDAPCTGFGTLRRNPDLKWRQRPEDLTVLARKQAAILESASRLLKPGGRLVYATCSILPAENDAIVDAFSCRHAEFEPLDAEALLAKQDIAVATGPRLRLWPHRHGTDGFFAAVFQRRAG
jgi:16S rRNA (cytosine967-C5)-methyltransferase